MERKDGTIRDEDYCWLFGEAYNIWDVQVQDGYSVWHVWLWANWMGHDVMDQNDVKWCKLLFVAALLMNFWGAMFCDDKCDWQ